ncbi:hypothetical protein J3998_07850 [Thiomicrorhabdus sp. 6S2-11]|uniref:Uncharacterized protein n=1 Tax=Thiomicrorhabdus marina TaxID=2818442 RepID=A0ABS3Q692_9GAMM|nr:hypothetical protein [Thiomicrorhabdus marina]MBO1927489.1 hypothetical protein [Thiomicrorhabdus marina]
MNIPRYTSNGFSHKSLLDRARQFRNDNESHLSLHQAKNQIAQDVGFKNWKILEKEPTNRNRDSFYYDAFSDREKYQARYEVFLEESGVEQSMDAYRDFVVQEFQRESSNKENKVEVQLLQEIIDRLQAFGPESLLPQNFPEYLLIKVGDAFESFFSEDEEASTSTVPPEIIILLNAAITSEKNRNWNGEMTISEQKFMDDLDAYRLYLSFERFKRSLGLEYSPPTISNIFDPNHKVEIKTNKEFFEKGKEVFGDNLSPEFEYQI